MQGTNFRQKRHTPSERMRCITHHEKTSFIMHIAMTGETETDTADQHDRQVAAEIDITTATDKHGDGDRRRQTETATDARQWPTQDGIGT